MSEQSRLFCCIDEEYVYSVGFMVFESPESRCMVAECLLIIRATRDYSDDLGDYTATFVDYTASRWAGDLF